MKRIIFDTETTGLSDDDEIIELAITDEKGKELYCQRFNATKNISHSASKVNGITDGMLLNMPSFKNEFSKIKAIFDEADQVMGYNVDFDIRLLSQTCELYGFDPKWAYSLKTRCVMIMYSNYAYDFYNITPTFRKHKLTNACEKMDIKIENAHSALGDCVMTAALIKKMHASCSEKK